VSSAAQSAVDANGLTFGQFLDAVAGRFAARPAIVASDRSHAEPLVVRKS